MVKFEIVSIDTRSIIALLLLFLRDSVTTKLGDDNGVRQMLRDKLHYYKHALADLTFAPGIVSQECLRCICMQESGCQPIGCHMDVGTLSCGYFQIKLPYWIDCGKPGIDWQSCANDIQCSSQCVQGYMKRYAQRHGCPSKCEGYAREHNGGPNGCNNPKTIPYWIAVQKQPGCNNVQLQISN